MNIENQFEKHPFSIDSLISEGKKMEEEEGYTYGDPGAPIHNLEKIIEKITPNQKEIISKALDPNTTQEDLDGLIESNTNVKIEGMYESVSIPNTGLQKHIIIRHFENGTLDIGWSH